MKPRNHRRPGGVVARISADPNQAGRRQGPHQLHIGPVGATKQTTLGDRGNLITQAHEIGRDAAQPALGLHLDAREICLRQRGNRQKPGNKRPPGCSLPVRGCRSVGIAAIIVDLGSLQWFGTQPHDRRACMAGSATASSGRMPSRESARQCRSHGRPRDCRSVDERILFDRGRGWG